MMKKNFILLLMILVMPFSLPAQESGKEAYLLGKQAIGLMNEKKFDDAIKLLDKAMALDSVPILYPYEKALCLFEKHLYERASGLLDSLTKHKEANEQVFQLLGNCYDFLAKKDLAIKAYQDGLELFPNSGRLFMELGTVKLEVKDVHEAVGYWESGVQVEPDYPMNYYRLTKYYGNTPEKVWALLYAEVFCNISDDTRKISEISSLIYNIYKAEFGKLKDNPANFKLTNLNLTVQPNNKKQKLPFHFLFQQIMKDAAKSVLRDTAKVITLNEISKIREQFINKWFKEGYEKTYPNVLLDFHKLLIKNKFFKEYNYILFKDAAKDEYQKWQKDNKAKYDKFIEFIAKNALKVTKENYFNRASFE